MQCLYEIFEQVQVSKISIYLTSYCKHLHAAQQRALSENGGNWLYISVAIIQALVVEKWKSRFAMALCQSAYVYSSGAFPMVYISKKPGNIFSHVSH